MNKNTTHIPRLGVTPSRSVSAVAASAPINVAGNIGLMKVEVMLIAIEMLMLMLQVNLTMFTQLLVVSVQMEDKGSIHADQTHPSGDKLSKASQLDNSSIGKDVLKQARALDIGLSFVLLSDMVKHKLFAIGNNAFVDETREANKFVHSATRLSVDNTLTMNEEQTKLAHIMSTNVTKVKSLDMKTTRRLSIFTVLNHQHEDTMNESTQKANGRTVVVVESNSAKHSDTVSGSAGDGGPSLQLHQDGDGTYSNVEGTKVRTIHSCMYVHLRLRYKKTLELQSWDPPPLLVDDCSDEWSCWGCAWGDDAVGGKSCDCFVGGRSAGCTDCCE